MTSFGFNIANPSMFQLAREGNFRAIAYLINRYLAPNGIYARTAPVQGGCLPVRVEFQWLPNNRDLFEQMRVGLTRFICHQIWRLNSEAIDGVRIVGLWAGSGEAQVLWNQTVRIVTPANQERQAQVRSMASSMVPQAAEILNFKILRAFLLGSSAVSAFILSFWWIYSDLNQPRSARVSNPEPMAPATTSSPRPQTVRAALETVPVVRHLDLYDPTDPTVTMMFGGDVTLGYAFEDLIGDNHQWAFNNMPEYQQADLAMVNLEGTLTNVDTEYPGKQFHFKADPEAVEVLTHGGVDIVNLANNHAMDYQADGLQETLATLDAAGIHYVGAGEDIMEARRPEIIEVKGQQIAYFGYYAADYHSAEKGVAGTNYALEERIAEDIKAIRDRVDWIIINFHWGEELSNYPQQWQSQLAHFTIDQGADVVVGHHPHVLQGAEIYKGRPIAYSLGNFIFGGNSRSDYDTAVLKVSVREKQMKVEFLPVEVRKYQPVVVSGNRGKMILENIEILSSIFEQPMASSMILDAATSQIVEDPDKSVFNTASDTMLSPSPRAAGDSETFDSTPFTTDSEITDWSKLTDNDSAPVSEDREETVEKREGVNPVVVGGAVAAATVAAAALANNRRHKIQLPILPRTSSGQG